MRRGNWPMIIKTDYQMWLTHNGEKEKMRIPVLPLEIQINHGMQNQSTSIAGFGEITITQGRLSATYSFASFFPATKYSGVAVNKLKKPHEYVNKIKKWQRSKKPVHFIVTGCGIDVYCTIENFQITEVGGDVGTLNYSLLLKEYRTIGIRKVKVKKAKTQPKKNQKEEKKTSSLVKEKQVTVTVPKDTTRINNMVTEDTYTVKQGDCLWNIAKKLLGDGSKWRSIYDLNKDKVKNPDLIYPGQVFKIPTQK